MLPLHALATRAAQRISRAFDSSLLQSVASKSRRVYVSADARKPPDWYDWRGWEPPDRPQTAGSASSGGPPRLLEDGFPAPQMRRGAGKASSRMYRGVLCATSSGSGIIQAHSRRPVLESTRAGRHGPFLISTQAKTYSKPRLSCRTWSRDGGGFLAPCTQTRFARRAPYHNAPIIATRGHKKSGAWRNPPTPNPV